MHVEVPESRGTILGAPILRIVGSTLGSPCLGKLPRLPHQRAAGSGWVSVALAVAAGLEIVTWGLSK